MTGSENGSSSGRGELFHGSPGADVEKDEESVSISAFQAAKWARRLVSTANNTRSLLARTLTAATQCDMHHILSVTSHTHGGVHGRSSNLNMSHAQVFTMLSHTFHIFSSSNGVSGNHFIPLLFHISQSLRTSWHTIKYLPSVTPPTELLDTATANLDASASVPTTPASASTGGT